MKSLYLLFLILAFSSGLFAQNEAKDIYLTKCTYWEEDNLFYDNETGELCNCMDTFIFIMNDENRIVSIVVDGFLLERRSYINEFLASETFYNDNSVADGAIKYYDEEGRLWIQEFMLNDHIIAQFYYNYNADGAMRVSSFTVWGDKDYDLDEWGNKVYIDDEGLVRTINYYSYDTLGTTFKHIKWAFNDWRSYYFSEFHYEYTVQFPDSTRPPLYVGWKMNYIGEYAKFYENGRIKEKGYYIEEGEFIGEKDGIWYFYNEDGTIIQKKYYDKGDLVKTEEFLEE